MENNDGVIEFGKFKISKCLKKDDHSAVYIAEHIFLNKKIILKTLNISTSKDLEKIERFKREGRILAKLDHPNLIRVLDFGTSNEYFYISFEYFKSKNLRQLLEIGSLNGNQKELLISQILAALSYAHNNKIIHRDLKPENILVDIDLNLKVSDFGLAVSIDENFVTDQYSIVGTPCYMSPEQIRGEKLTIKSDLFSAGIIFYELLIGKNPFLGKDINESLNNILNYKEDVFLSEIKLLPEKYQSLLSAALKKNPELRLNSAKDGLKILGAESDKKISVLSTEPNRKYYKRLILTVLFILLITVLIFIFKYQFSSKEKITKLKSVDSSTISSHKEANDTLITNSVNETSTNQLSDNKLTTKLSLEEIESGENINVITESNTKEIMGSLWIECIPWAQIIIDQKIIETTPLKYPIQLKAGVHQIIFNHPDYPEIEKSVQIKSGETENLKINLKDYSAYLFFKVYPWGEIFINGKFVEQTPLNEPIKIAPGKIIVTIKNPKFENYSEAVIINGGDSLFIQHKFQ